MCIWLKDSRWDWSYTLYQGQTPSRHAQSPLSSARGDIRTNTSTKKEFPSGVPSNYYPGPVSLNFSVRLVTGASNMALLLACLLERVKSTCSSLAYVQALILISQTILPYKGSGFSPTEEHMTHDLEVLCLKFCNILFFLLLLLPFPISSINGVPLTFEALLRERDKIFFKHLFNAACLHNEQFVKGLM